MASLHISTSPVVDSERYRKVQTCRRNAGRREKRYGRADGAVVEKECVTDMRNECFPRRGERGDILDTFPGFFFERLFIPGR